MNITPQPSNLDEDGHVIFRQLQRQFSLTGSTTAMSCDRLPADGEARSENAAEAPEEQTNATEREESGEQSERGEQVEGAEPNPSAEHLEQGDVEGQKDTGKDLEPEREPDLGQQGERSDFESRPTSGNRMRAGRSDQDVQNIITRTGTETEEVCIIIMQWNLQAKDTCP